MPRGNHVTARQHRDWLKNLSIATGKKLTTIAKEINVAPSTLTRPLKEGDDGTSTLHANTIAKVVAHTGVAPPDELRGFLPDGRRRPPIGLGEEASPYQAVPGDAVETVLRALGGDRNSVAPWTLNTRALELEGFLPGDIVLVDRNATPEPGDAVCAQIHEWPDMKAETVMRIYQRAAGVNLLVPRTADGSIAQPHVVDGERVVIKGVLMPHRLRPTHRRPAEGE